jgi:quercetin dioxygenase-like cupin family protein
MSEERLELTPTETVVVLPSEDDSLLVAVTYLPGKRPPKHYHPAQAEQIEVVAGTLRAWLDGVERDYEAGETIELPVGTVHSFWNPGTDPVEARWRTTPAGRTEEWFRAIDRVRREGRVGEDGMPGPLAFGVYLTEYRDTFRLAGPDWLLRPALALLGAIGRRRGYRP